ncbi:activating molecule in BECN1-regulated autophagy protein 1-like [Elysia marginata]|uniref:Activating molecule in BECN1-regulated autophagy protein 1-like n=1 Tax=Elysia marginata TaxID=1093978 RepID=A0AAV4IC59_9GAST|nr:activating molecule in BECN1-regulated autophagy protein 1-like [Elysia marginata]
MKEHLRGQRFETEEDIIQATKVAIKNLDKCSYFTAFKDWLQRIEKCANNASANIVVRNCKLHNDASCSLSRDGKLLAAFVPTHRGFPDKMVLGVFSLENGNFAQCLYTKSFGPNAISVSISPENSYLLVGTAAKRMFFFSTNQLVGKIFKMVKQKAGESSMKHKTDLFYFPENRTGFCSVNSACWLPEVGMGLVFGTNKGDLVFSRPRSKRHGQREPYIEQESPRLSEQESPRLREPAAHRTILDFIPRWRHLTGVPTTSSNNTQNNNNSSGSNFQISNNPVFPTMSTWSSNGRSSWRSSATQTSTIQDHRSTSTQTRSGEEGEEDEVAEVAI